MPRLAWPILLALALAACNSTSAGRGTSVVGYDCSCASVVDCVPVATGPTGCCGSGCPDEALSANAASTYTADRAAVTAKACAARPVVCDPAGGSSCPSARVACTNGLCEVLVPDASTD